MTGGRGVYHKQYCRTMACSTRIATSRRGGDAGLPAGRGWSGTRCQHLRGHLVPHRADDRADARRGRGGRLDQLRRRTTSASACYREKMLATRAADHVGYLAFVNPAAVRTSWYLTASRWCSTPSRAPRARARVRGGPGRPRLDLDAVFRRGLRDLGGVRRSGRRAIRSGGYVSRPSRSGPAPVPPRSTVFLDRDAEVYAALVTGRGTTPGRTGSGASSGLSGGDRFGADRDDCRRRAGPRRPSGCRCHRSSRPRARRRTRVIAWNLGIEFMTLPITPAYRCVPPDPRRRLQGTEGGRAV